MFEHLNKEEIKNNIKILVKLYSKLTHSDFNPDLTDRLFVPGETTIPYAGRVFDEVEVVAAVDSVLDFSLTLGKEGEHMEKELAKFLGIRKSLLMNSSSSSNLVSLSALI